MLRLLVPEKEFFDERTEEFFYSKEQILTLEHSLVSLSKWESRWEKPFFKKDELSIEETIDYIRCMTITQNVDPLVYYAIDDDILTKVSEYIERPMTATTFSDIKKSGKRNGQIVTAELIYYWMIIYNVPFECQKWHLNKLMTLLQVCSVESGPKKKMSRREITEQYAALNEARCRKLNTKG